MTGEIMQLRFKYLVEDVDRFGNVRIYVRVPGRRKVRIRAPFGTDEFLAKYNAAVSDHVTAPRQAREAKPGSFRHLCQLYMSEENSEWTRLDISTRSWQRRALERICQQHGEKPVAMMTPKHIRKLRDELKKTPAASKHRLKALRAMFRWAIEDDDVTWVEKNPTLEVQAAKYVTKGHHSWSIEEVEQYENRHVIGTQARLALDILLYTACRREDAPRFGPQHLYQVKQGDRITVVHRLRYRQGKNEDRAPVDMDIPVRSELLESIRATPSGHLTFLMTEFGKPFTTNGFGNKFKHWCRQANLPHCSAHGVRKATPARMAEKGATPHEIMSITGHQTLAEVERYTKAARMAKIADTAVTKMR